VWRLWAAGRDAAPAIALRYLAIQPAAVLVLLDEAGEIVEDVQPVTYSLAEVLVGVSRRFFSRP